ncbi:MAG: hypothetical protein AMXMBFR33_57750 [Candidatus Xenobia bacterium]
MNIREAAPSQPLTFAPTRLPVGEPAGPTALELPLDRGPEHVDRRRSLDARYDAYMKVLLENKKVADLSDAELQALDSRGANVSAQRASRGHLTAREAVRLSNADKSGEISKMLSLRPDLREEDLFEEDINGNKFLRPSLQDPNRRATLAARPDLRPIDLDNTRDPKMLTLLSKRRDLRPPELEQMKQGFFDRIKPYFPPAVAASLAQQCSDESMEVMSLRGPDTRPDSLMRLYDSIHGAVGPMGGQQTPFLFLKGLSVLKSRPDISPDGLSLLAGTVGDVGHGASSASIGGCLDRCFTALLNPDMQLGQVLGAAEGARQLPPDPNLRMEVLGRTALGLEPAGRPRQEGPEPKKPVVDPQPAPAPNARPQAA